MRDLVAHAAPQAPARNAPYRHPSTASLETYNSHRKISHPKRIYRPVRRHTLSRIDEAPQQVRPRSKASIYQDKSQPTYKSFQLSDKSVQQSTEFSSTRPMLRSRSNISADTSRSVPVCNQSNEVTNQLESGSPQYVEPGYDSSSSYDRQASMTDLPIAVPVDPATGAYIPYPEYSYYHDERCGFNRWKFKGARKHTKTNNLFLAFMY